jgi:hypothetical protein
LVQGLIVVMTLLVTIVVVNVDTICHLASE